MSKNSRFRRPFDKWHGKRAETLFKGKQLHLYDIYWSLWRQFSWKKSLWMICKILGTFVNPWTADEKYSLLNNRNLLQRFQMKLSQKGKTFWDFLLNFLNLRSILNIFKIKMTLIADVFLNLRTPKNVVRKISKKSPFRGSFDK